MKRFFTTVFLASALFLTACQSSSPNISTDEHTGVTLARAARVEVHSGLLSALYATPEHSSRAGYRIFVWYDNSGLGWQNFEQAWSFGKQYPFVSTNREVGSCAGGSCITIEEGYILMNEADFKKAAKNGFTFKLAGKGSIEGTIPASAFQQVLMLLGK